MKQSNCPMGTESSAHKSVMVTICNLEGVIFIKVFVTFAGPKVLSVLIKQSVFNNKEPVRQGLAVHSEHSY